MSKDEDKAPPASAGSGDAFFDRAEQVAETGNWDFAIDMYLKGLRRDPDNVERGHEPLRAIALQRKSQGGKGAGMMAKLKVRPGKDGLESLIRAEEVLSKDPGALDVMMVVLKSAQQLELAKAVPWIGGVIIDAQRVAKKTNKRVLMEVAEAFAVFDDFTHAIEACDLAKQSDPNDATLAQMLTEYSTKYTIQKGKYGQEGDFTKGVKDLEHQQELSQQDAMVKDRSFLDSQIEKSRAEYLQDPALPGKINAYVDALLKVEEDAPESQAIEVLNKAHEVTGSFQFKMRIGDIKIRQMTRKWREFKEAGKDDEAKKQARLRLAFELEEYNERAVNYPTDLTIKYELGRRQLLAGRFDDAIGNLQQASNDPRRRLQALNALGMAFGKKGYLREAAETYQRALQGDVPELRTKELLYNLGDVQEKMEELDGARDAFSQLAQIDYQYKDVRERLEAIRGRLKGGDEDE